MAQGRPGAGGARVDQHPGGILERSRARQPALVWNANAVKRDLGLPDRPGGRLALHRRRLVAIGARLDEESLDLTVLVRARPHDDHIRDRAVSDPTLPPVKDPVVAVPARSAHGHARTAQAKRRGGLGGVVASVPVQDERPARA